jgi:hypothetical protein
MQDESDTREGWIMKRIVRIATAGLLTLGLMAPATGALAKGGSGQIRTGSCSAASDWKLKAKADDGAIEVEFEVDSNRVGQTWHVTLLKNGNVFFTGNRTTKAPSGSFTVSRRTPNPAGADTIKGRARNPNSGETCVGRLTFTG